MSNYSNFQYKELDPKTQTTSPYRNGLKDRNFVNPSLISHDVFYNQEYPQRDPIIPYCRKKQEVSEKITRSRCITPQPSRNSPNKSERISVQRERNNINYNNILKIEEKPILKTETEFKNNKQTKQENEFYEPEPINQIYENLQNNKEIDKNFNKDENYNYDNKSVKSIKSSTVSSFTRNADNLICDYCVNQDIIDRKKKEQELQNKLNLQQKSALNEYNQASLREEYLKNQEKKKLIKENANFLVQTIENKKYNNNNVKNIEKLTEIEHLRLIEENLKEENFKKSQLEKEKTINYRQQLEKQMENKYYENNQKLNENKSMKNLGLEINNQYNNPYLPKKEDYINEIERQKEELYKKKLMEKEFDKNYIELSQKQQRKFNEDVILIKKNMNLFINLGK